MPPLPSLQTAERVLARHYLEIRCQLLDIAGALDRIDRADNTEGISNDPRMRKLQEGLTILQSSGPGRAERIQMLFSDEYLSGWQSRA